MKRIIARAMKPIVSRVFEPDMGKCYNLSDIERAARGRCHRFVYDYIAGGSDDERAVANNRKAFTAYEQKPYVLNGVGPKNVSLKTKLLGSELEIPFISAPIAGNSMFHTDAEVAVAKQCKRFGTAYALSTLATSSCSEINEALGGSEEAKKTPRMFQLYVWKQGKLVDDSIKRAKEAGFETLVLTVDLTWFGNRERDKRNGFSIPPKIFDLNFVLECLKKPCWTVDALIAQDRKFEYAALRDDEKLMEKQRDDMAGFVHEVFNPTFDWEDAKVLRKQWGKKFILKGVHRAEDAIKAFEYLDADAVWISNHGGRQLDGAIAPIDALKEIREAVGESRELIIDGGIQRGSDIALALALGANAVAIGKPIAFGLAAAGEKGVERTFTILKEELERTMGLCGTRTIDDLRTRGKDIFVRSSL